MVKEEGLENDLIDRICADPEFGLSREEIESFMQPEFFTGRSASQVEEFVAQVVKPVLEANKEILG